MADDQLSEALKEAENDLLDSYVCGELGEKERLLFEENYLDSPEKHKHIEIARLLMDPAVRRNIVTAPIPSPRKHSWWHSFAFFFQARTLKVTPYMLVAGMAIVAAMAVLFTVQNYRLRAELSKLEVEQVKLRRQIATQGNLNNVNTDGKKATDGSAGQDSLLVATALLKPGLSRGSENGGNDPLIIAPAASLVMLLLDLSSDRYSRYAVTIETPEGKITHRIEGLRSRPSKGGRIIEVPLARQELPRGDYVLTLLSAESNRPPQTVDFYSFSVVR